MKEVVAQYSPKYKVTQKGVSNEQLPSEFRAQFSKGVYYIFLPEVSTYLISVNANKSEAETLMKLFDGDPEQYQQFVNELKGI